MNRNSKLIKLIASLVIGGGSDSDGELLILEPEVDTIR